MTKAWVGLIPVMILLVFEIVARGSHVIQWKFVSISLILATAVALPWHLWEWWHSRSAFVHDYIVVNLFGRMAGAVEGHHFPALYYFDVISKGFPFWKSSCFPLSFGRYGERRGIVQKNISSS